MEKLEIILNKHKEWHWFLCSLFLFNFINKNVHNWHISVFCFGTEIGTENRGFSLVLVPNTEILVP